MGGEQRENPEAVRVVAHDMARVSDEDGPRGIDDGNADGPREAVVIWTPVEWWGVDCPPLWTGEEMNERSTVLW